MRIIWSEIAQATFVRFMADQAGMMAVNRAVEALADDPAPLGAFVRGAYRRLRVGPYRVLYEVEGNLITIVRIDKVQAARHHHYLTIPRRVRWSWENAATSSR